jgi:hypothetical protein
MAKDKRLVPLGHVAWEDLPEDESLEGRSNRRINTIIHWFEDGEINAWQLAAMYDELEYLDGLLLRSANVRNT